ncbi:MAG TPA: hypothetical protein VKF59_22400 [Candidatus Dormibacteraeota bacterium]|nr:hypothetical protein [Candidatus Dormibacteraeota bacterium]
MVYAGAAPGGTLVQYDARAGIQCGRPGNTAPYGAGTPRTTTNPVPDGTPCQTVYYAPVTFQDLPGTIRARWQSPAGPAASAAIDPNSNGAVVSAAGVTAATNDVSALYKQLGTYQGGQCQLSGGWEDFCQLGDPLPNPDPCILAEPHRIVPATSPPPSVQPYVQEVLRDLRAQPGAVRSLPSPYGLVNLPTCFWIDGIGVPGERDLTMVLPGPPDPSNRRIYYTYLIRVFFAGVRWDFDDPYGNDQVLPHPACGQHPQLTAHSYQMISEKRSADGFYHVTATEEYQVTVDLYWADTYGAHHQPVDPGVPLPIEVTPPGPLDQYVGQVEAIPVSQASPGG